MVDSDTKQAIRLEDQTTLSDDKKTKTSRRNKMIKVFIGGCVWILSIFLAVGLSIIGYVEGNKWISRQDWFRRLKGEKYEQQYTKDKENGGIIYEKSQPVEISNDITEVVEKVSPSVVSVAKVSFKLESSDTIGTGFIIDNQHGYLLTNQHVVSDVKARYAVITYDGKKYDVDKIFRDDANDIAILKVDFGDNNPQQVEFGDSDSLKVGQIVIAIGNPLGEYPGTVTHGIVSGLHRDVEASDAYGNVKMYEDVIQTDAAINFGNSGGPLLNMAGQVVGINFGINRSHEAEGISFAIPINKVKERLAVFNKFGYFPKPYLGVFYEMIGEIESLMYQVPQGAFIKDVAAGSPAERAGIHAGDIIIEVEGKPLDKPLAFIIQSYAVGDNVRLKIWRSTAEGKEKTFEVTVKLEDGGRQ